MRFVQLWRTLLGVALLPGIATYGTEPPSRNVQPPKVTTHELTILGFRLFKNNFRDVRSKLGPAALSHPIDGRGHESPHQICYVAENGDGTDLVFEAGKSRATANQARPSRERVRGKNVPQGAHRFAGRPQQAAFQKSGTAHGNCAHACEVKLMQAHGLF
jgi:hypothetical protein